MATNYVQEGKNVSFVAGSGGVSSGDGVLSGNLFGVSVADYAESATGIMATEGCFTLAKKGTDTFTLHQTLYFDTTNKYLTETSTSNYPVGVAMGVYGNGTTSCVVRLNGVSTAAAA